jgi:hypothetical protein
MAGVRSWAQHGTVRRYRQGGCDDLIGGQAGVGARCADCRAAINEFQSRERVGVSHVQRKISLVKGKRSPSGSVTSMPTRAKGGPVEQSVSEQLSEYAADQPVRVQMAIVCARILDNPDRVALHATTVRQLEGIVDKLTATTKKKSRGRLAIVQSMTARR